MTTMRPWVRMKAWIALVILIGGCGGAEPAVSPATPNEPAVAPTTAELSPTTNALPEPSPKAAPTVAPSLPAAPTPRGGAVGLIAFYSDRDGNPEIYVMHPDGSDQRRLTFSQYEDSSPDWSPDGGQIAFVSDRDDPQAGECFPDCQYQIYVIKADGSDEHRLVETEFRALHPDWHPDGTKLSFDTEFNLEGDIYVVNADGSSLQRLIEDGFWADWSPDGTQIAFASNRDGNAEIYVADADGSNQRRLTENGHLDYFPAWSPDGRSISFTRLEKKQIFVMNVDGSNEQQLTYQSNAENPSWSPDGTQIVYQSSHDGDFEIYVVTVEEATQGKGGSGPRQLTENGVADLWPSWLGGAASSEFWFDETPMADSAQAEGDGLYLGQQPPGSEMEVFAPGIVSIEDGKEYKITFSPDLQEIFFTRRTPGGRNDRLWYSRLEGGELTMPELAPFTHDSLESDACFTPDGKRLYFNSWRPLPGEDVPSDHHNVWFVDRTADGWSEPQFLGPPLNDYRPVYFSIADDGTLYFTRARPREIWFTELKDGQYQEAQRMPNEINYLPNIAHPGVAPDESYVIIDSYYQLGDRLAGYLFISFQKPDGSWTKAVSLRDALNAPDGAVHAAPRITPDGKYLFFEEYRAETDQADIYWVSTEVIEEMRAQVTK